MSESADLKRYYIKFPADAYALGPIGPMRAEDVREWARSFSGVKRLPKGFEFWPE